jgi:broad specificity phosphatase PhoE
MIVFYIIICFCVGMNCHEPRNSIRIEPGLLECPHLNYKIVDSFMSKTELTDNGYNIKVEYKPLIQKINSPESLDEYFDRSAIVMRGIINRYVHRGGTVLIVTHAPGLLALTDVIKGVRPNEETFYRTVSAYPPLAIYIAEYDGAKWRHSEQPFSITPLGQ